MNFELLRNEFEIIKSTKRERLIAIISATLCVIFLVVIIILAARKTPDLEQQLPIQPDPNTAPLQEICTTKECVRSALDIMTAMNESVDPCDDFYRFTCDRWKSEHRNNNWFSKNSDFAKVEEKLITRAIKFFEQNESADEPKPVRQSRDMYHACLDQDTRDNDGYKSIYKYLSQIGLPAVPRYFNMTKTNDDIKSYKFDWIKTDAAMNKLLNLHLFINCDVGINIFNTSKNMIVFGIPHVDTLGYPRLPTDGFIAVKNNSVKSKLHDARMDFEVFALTTLISEKYDLPDDFTERLSNALDAIYDIDTLFNEVKKKTSHITEFNYSQISMNDLQNYTDAYLRDVNVKPNMIWKPYLHQLFDGMNVSLDLDGKNNMIQMFTEHKIYYADIASLAATQLDAKIELWAWWKAVKNLLIHTTFEAKHKMYQVLHAANGHHTLPMDIGCASLIKYNMDFAVTYALLDKSFLNTTKPKVEQMLHNIKDAFEVQVDSLTWMDYRTKVLTIEKSRAMKELIGFPEWLLNKNLLENYYSTLNTNPGTHLDNIIQIVKLKRKISLEQLNLINKNEWIISPMTVNAFNKFNQNTMIIPMGILNYPFYNRGLEVLNYGSLGTILGHELTHGFDTIGRLYDKYGNFKQWWSKSTLLHFYKEAVCFIQQYGNFHIPEIHSFINGKITLGENIADNGGLHHAYLAYQTQKSNTGIEIKLPGLEKYTNDQLFFLSYANVWCNEESLYSLETSLNVTHAPNKYRVLGTLMNSEEFSAAFNCPVGSNMNPMEPKCKIW